MAGSGMAGSTAHVVRPTPAVRSTRRAVLLLVATAALVAILELALSGVTFGPVLFVLVAGTYLGAGALAWWWRPSNRLGAIMVLGCLCVLVGGFGFTAVPVLVAASQVGATLILAVMVHLLHAFPSGRLRGQVSRWTVLAGWIISLVLQAPAYLFTAPSPDNLLGVVDRPDLAAAGAALQATLGAAVMLVTTVVLVHRLRAADRPRRRVLAPLYAYGVFAVLFIPVSASVLRPLFDLPQDVVGGTQLAVIAGVPLTFTFALLRGGFARTGEVEELGAWLGGRLSRTTLTEVLARTLGDPSLRVAFRAPDGDPSRGDRSGDEGYVDTAGRPVELPGTGGDRAVVEVDVEGRRVGAIDYDATLLTDPEPVRAAGRVVALAVDHERLTAQLRAGQELLRRSRERMVEAGDRERRRIAQNLHDGLQARLVILALDAQRIAADPAAAPSTVEAAASLRARLDGAAGDLRRFVHEVMPAPLLERGLAAAAEDLVDHLPLPTDLVLAVPPGAVPAAVESSAYLILSEALSNAVRHARADRLSVRVEVAGDLLRMQVGDDGVGGAHPGGGLGLNGIADRVDALGGTLALDSPPGGGTMLSVELPCVS